MSAETRNKIPMLRKPNAQRFPGAQGLFCFQPAMYSIPQYLYGFCEKINTRNDDI